MMARVRRDNLEPSMLLKGEFEGFETCEQRVRNSDPAKIAEELLALRSSLHSLTTRNYYAINALKVAHMRVKLLENKISKNDLELPGKSTPPEDADKQDLVVHYNVE